MWDYSTRRNHGNATNLTWTAEGIEGGAVQLNGSDSQIISAQHLGFEGNAPRTMSLWCKASSLSTNANAALLQTGGSEFYGHRFGLRAYMEEQHLRYFFHGHNSDRPMGSRAPHTWVHLCVSYNGQELSYYMDGVHMKTEFRALSTADSPLTIGSLFRNRAKPGWPPFHGFIDEVMVWDRPLTRTEVRNIYDATGGTPIEWSPKGAIAFAGRHYKYFPASLTWLEAQKKCNEMGGNLVCIPNEPTGRFLTRLSQGNKIHLGATDKEEEGTWRWVNGQPFRYTAWNSGEPNNTHATEHFLEADPDGWNDTTAHTQNTFICEWK